jgi:hypothetical protein
MASILYGARNVATIAVNHRVAAVDSHAELQASRPLVMDIFRTLTRGRQLDWLAAANPKRRQRSLAAARAGDAVHERAGSIVRRHPLHGHRISKSLKRKNFGKEVVVHEVSKRFSSEVVVGGRHSNETANRHNSRHSI